MFCVEQDYKQGDKVYRRGQLCEIVSIDELHTPPSYSVKILEEGRTVETEACSLTRTLPTLEEEEKGEKLVNQLTCIRNFATFKSINILKCKKFLSMGFSWRFFS